MPAGAWSTVALPAEEQFSFWREVVWEAFTPVSLAVPRRGGFLGSVSVGHAGPLRVSQIASQPQFVRRTEALVRRQPGDIFFLNLPLDEGTYAVQDGRTARLNPGDLVLIDGTRPFTLGFNENFKQISVIIPHDVLMPRLATPLAATAVRVAGRCGVGAIAADAVRSLAAQCESLTQPEGRVLADWITQLLALALGSADTGPRPPSRALLLQAALDAVERFLGDSELSPSHVAGHIGVSPRYLHELFTDHGVSFSQWVLIRRLERCHRDLTDQACAQYTIAAVAASHGLPDPSHFARTFKNRYGTTASDLRRDAGNRSRTSAGRPRQA